MEAYEGREPYIFISYARTDSDKVTPFLEALSNAGYRFWYDRSTQGGADWLEVLLGKVAACEVFCPLFSEAFKNSHYCYEETEWAYQKRKTIVPVYLEALTPDGLRLFYQRLLQSRQTLRLYDCANAAEFVDGLGREQAFKPCKKPEWTKNGQIQWLLSADGVLTIAKNEDMDSPTGSIHDYDYGPIDGLSTAPWMSRRDQIFSVEIADDIDKIGDCAFRGCESLTDVRIGDSVTQIGARAFQNCESLTDVRIGDSVTQIRASAFDGCESLTTVRIPDSVTRIGGHAFSDCVSLTDIRIPDSVTRIGVCAFADCECLTTVHIGDSVTQIGVSAFDGCASLTDVRIPDSVIEIGDCAFWDCESLKSIEIPAGATFVVGGEWPSFPAHTRVIRRVAPGEEGKALLKCTRCGREALAGMTTKAVELDAGGLLVVRHIPCYRCGNCGEVMYTGDVVRQMESLTERAEAALQEITVINYARAR